MARRGRPRKVTYFEPVPPRLSRNAIIESTFEVGRRFRCTMRVDCGRLDPRAVIEPEPGGWHPRMPERLDEGSSRIGAPVAMRVYRLAGLTVGAGRGRRRLGEHLSRTDYVADSFMRNTT